MSLLSPLMIIVILSPFLLQFSCFFFLIWYNLQHSKAKAFSFNESFFLLFALVLIPALMFGLSFLFIPEYKSQKGDHWFYYINDGYAGLTLVPIYVIASIHLALLLFNPQRLATSRANYIMVATLAVIAAWYTFATLALNFTNAKLVPAIVPAITCLNYLLFLSIIKKRQQPQPASLLFIFVWFSALITSLLAKYPLAKRIYEQLPEERPYGYGDCFVVSAAAKGHPKLVKSWIHPNIGKPVNHQWYTFKHFETLISVYFPKVHHILRYVYNRVGPFVAKRIYYTWQADLIYLLLKPLEWLITFIFKLVNYR